MCACVVATEQVRDGKADRIVLGYLTNWLEYSQGESGGDPSVGTGNARLPA